MTNNSKWEYRIEKFQDGAGEKTLCDVGERGWELVAVVMQFNVHFAYLKRKVEVS